MRIYYLMILGYLLGNIYIMLRSLYGLKLTKRPKLQKWGGSIFVVIYGLSALCLPIAYFLPTGHFHTLVQRYANFFEGVIIYTCFAFVFIDLVFIVLRLTKISQKPFFKNTRNITIFGVIIVSSIIITCFYGFHHAKVIYVKNFAIEIDKPVETMDELKVALVADLHMGYSIGADHIENMVEKINSQNVDLVLIAGDVFDNTVKDLEEPERIKAALQSIKSKYGIYGCWGNHDIDERLFGGFSIDKLEDEYRSKEMEQFMEDCNIIMLSDESVLIQDAFYLVGRKDDEKAGDGTRNRKTLDELLAGVDLTKPVFVVDHEPKHLSEVASYGIDIMFSGHTHDGQIFPLNITDKISWQNPSGLLKVDGMYSLVTSGVGIYGPYMRVGTDADVTIANIQFIN